MKKLISRKIWLTILFISLVGTFTVLSYCVATLEPGDPPNDSVAKLIIILKWTLLVTVNILSLLGGNLVVSEIERIDKEIKEKERKIKEWEEQDSV
jgi:hypothetical protein